MVANSLIKLIDESIIPAIALIVGKMLGLFLAIYFLDLSFTLRSGSILIILPSVQFANLTDYIVAENYSNLAMFAVVVLGTIFVLIRAHYFHQSHIHPTLHAKLVSLNLDSLVAPSYHLYHQAAIWLTFLWLTVAFLVISTILKITYIQISAITFIIAANFSWVFALDVQKEVEIARSS